jgi:hypothetical protein
MSFLSAGKQALNGRGSKSEQARTVAERDQVIGEITIANRILKKLSGDLS